MITADLVCVHNPNTGVTFGAQPRDGAERWLAQRMGWPDALRGDVEFQLVPASHCACCGQWTGTHESRCWKHRERNPCIVEGCTRTRLAKWGLNDDDFICGEHWRRYVPPRSPHRRTQQRFFKLAKKLGYARNAKWPAELEERYWRFWRGLIRRVRRLSTEGRFDMADVNRLFGWGNDE